LPAEKEILAGWLSPVTSWEFPHLISACHARFAGDIKSTFHFRRNDEKDPRDLDAHLRSGNFHGRLGQSDDQMKRDAPQQDSMKNGQMKKEKKPKKAAKKDQMKKDDTMKDDSMKHDDMKKDETKKDEMKQN